MERSGFFDAHVVGDSYDRVYLSADFAGYFSSFIGNGVLGGILSNELKVNAMNDGGMFVSVKPGKAFIKGYWYENGPDDLIVPISRSDGALDRIDNIVVRWTLPERKSKVVVVEGEYSSTPIPPVLERNDALYDLKLAEVYVRHGTLNILNTDITDTRGMQDVCGFASIKSQLVNTHQNETFHLEQFPGFEPGLEPARMTLLLREAVTYAYENGYHTLRFPPNSSITVGVDSSTGATVSDGGTVVTLPNNLGIDLNGSLLRLSPNEFTKKGYNIVALDGEKSFLINGKIYGDYAVPDATHQWGCGILARGQNAKIENVEIENFLGDGIYLEEKDRSLVRITGKDSWESGNNYIMTTNFITLTRLNEVKEVQLRFSAFNFEYSPFYDITFYDEGQGTIKTIKAFIGADIIPPQGYKYCKVKIYSNNPDAFFEDTCQYNDTYIWETSNPTHSISIKNVYIHKIGRNGITLGNVHNVNISDFIIYDVNGTAPKAGIDIEEGREQSYANVIQRGFISNCDYAIDFASGNSFTLENIYEVDNRYGLYGQGSSGFNVRSCIFNDATEIGREMLQGTNCKTLISSSSFAQTVVVKGVDFDDCCFYFCTKVMLSQFSTCRNSMFYSDSLGATNTQICGGFINCNFVHGVYTYTLDTTRVDPSRCETFFEGCRFKDTNRISFNQSRFGGHILPIEHIVNCYIEVTRCDGITARKIMNTEIKGLQFWNGSTFSQVNFVSEFITGCHIERYLNDLNRNISEYGLGIIWINQPTVNTAWIPSAMVISNNTFVGMLSKTEAPATVDYAVKIENANSNMPIYINNNYCLRKAVGSGNTLQLKVIKNNASETAVVDTQNNYGFASS